MAKDNNIAGQLQDLLITRGFESEIYAANGRPVNTADEGKTFRFDYKGQSGKNYGTMVIVLAEPNDMLLMYGDNLGRAMEDPEDREDFFDFQHHLRDFAHRRRWTVTPTDISKMKHVQSGLAAIKEGLFEGYYGTRQISYQGQATEARLMIRHSRPLRETDARHQHVDSLFIETAEGERFKLPFRNLMAGRAMLEHVRQGGRPYDIRGTHIVEMVTELQVLNRFRRAARNRVNESVTQDLVEQVDSYYRSLRHSLQHLGSHRGYQSYFETWHPAQIQPQEALVENIKSLFVEQRIDDRIEAALPLLAKIQQGTPMKEIEIFENWIDNLSEGTWKVPQTAEDMSRLKALMAQELVVGPDAAYATQELSDLVGDDELYDQLAEIARYAPDADVRDTVLKRLGELGVDTEDLVATTDNAMTPDSDAVKEDSAVFETGCNMTNEGEYCPEHGLAECGMYEMGTVAGAVAPMEDSTDPMDHRGAVTDSFYESELDRMKKLALAK